MKHIFPRIILLILPILLILFCLGCEKPVKHTGLPVSSVLFKKLERPPVLFDHDLHTVALKEEKCAKCHPENNKGGVVFTFPKAPDLKNDKRLRDSFHEACIGCHKHRLSKKLSAGPTDCGECHAGEKQPLHEPSPLLPGRFVGKDPYHNDCLACHAEKPEKHGKAEPLNWKAFYIRDQAVQNTQWSSLLFGYKLHGVHDKALEGKCEPCHFIPPERQKRLSEQGKKPENRDWVMDIDTSGGLTERKTAHERCVNCHLSIMTQNKKAGPLECAGCHAAKTGATPDAAAAAGPLCGQKEAFLISLKDSARAKPVPFNHKRHEAANNSCQACHHKTLRPCGECHTPAGSSHGNGITLAEAFHSPSSAYSCVGCHNRQKEKPECAGCHSLTGKGMAVSACNTCHSGSLDRLKNPAKRSLPVALFPESVKDSFAISLMEQSYHAAKMPHLAMASKLADLSARNRLSAYFHDDLTLCAGCHHHAPLQARGQVPKCFTCHPNRKDTDPAVPSLLGAYHQLCLGCHQRMDPAKLPVKCNACHDERKDE